MFSLMKKKNEKNDGGLDNLDPSTLKVKNNRSNRSQS